MKLTYKKDGNNYKIFNVRDDSNGFPHFLVYIDSQWKYISAKYFKVK